MISGATISRDTVIQDMETVISITNPSHLLYNDQLPNKIMKSPSNPHCWMLSPSVDHYQALQNPC